MMQEFKAFAMKGNVLDLAVGVVIGAAFGTIVSSLVGDILMPVLGIAVGGIDFTGLALHVGDANIAYGKFIQALCVFGIVAVTLFFFVKTTNSFKRKEHDEASVPPASSKELQLLMEIRDSLRSRRIHSFFL